MMRVTLAVLACAIGGLSACVSPNPSKGQWPYPSAPQSTPAPETVPPPYAPVVVAPPPVMPPIIAPQPIEPPPVPEVRPPLLPNYPRTIEATGLGTGVMKLVQQARADKSAGRFDASAAALERAMRIEPGNPWLLSELSKVHLAAKQYELAQNTAQRSNSKAVRNPWIELDNWRVINACANARGDVALSLRARTKQEELERLTAPRPPLNYPRN